MADIRNTPAAPAPATYEKRDTDFYYRDDRDGRVALRCSPHLHYHIEFVCMLGGESRAYADAEECRIRQGDIFIVFPNQVHRFVTTMPEKYRLFIVSPDLMPEFLPLLTSGVPRSSVIPGAAALPEIDSLTAALSSFGSGSEHDSDSYRDAAIRGYLLALFGRLLPMMSLTSPRTGDSRALREVVAYCSQNFAQALSLDLLEAELHLSKYYISHLFSGKLGIRFNDYINSLRISHACRLLRRDDMQITEIAEAVGFNTLRTFNRAFSRFRGMSPTEYRKSGMRRSEAASMLPVFQHSRDNAGANNQ